MRKFLTNITFLILALTGIFSLTASAQANRLDSKQWNLTHLNGQPVHDSKAFIELNADNKKLTGNGGCSRIFGSVTATRSSINFSHIGSTRMACTNRDTMRLENEFIRTLERVNSYQTSGRMLKLFRGRQLVAQFKSSDQADDGSGSRNGRLEDKKWVLDEIKGSPIPKVRETAFISFDAAKKSAGGNTSCNGFGGSYAVNGSKLRIFDVIHTMRACIEDQRMNVEGGMLSGLQDTNRYEIRGNRLYLYRGNDVLLTFRGERK
ncbi:MAG TPA: META domain-containing protein [Pyrinomonadaceae bacterium]|nr:META domain-containing protein [Pyrinomonadaceae bacterium]